MVESQAIVYLFLFLKAGVSTTNTVKISKRPTSIMNEQNHLMKAGNCDHDIVGPISVPNVGPTLLRQLKHIDMALVLSTPAAMMIKANMKYVIICV